MGLGNRSDLGLADARDKARAYRKQLRAGATPASIRSAERRQVGMTFETAARTVFEDRKAAWKNSRHRDEWIGSLQRHVFPVIGDIDVDRIGSPEVMETLEPIWMSHPETSERIFQRINAILEWSIAKEYRLTPSPMTAVRKAVPKRPKQTQHYKALPYQQIPDLMNTLRQKPGMGALALRYTLLCAARSGEVRAATWSEIDLHGRVWTIDGAKMKAGQTHSVPLSKAAIEVLKQARELHDGELSSLIFPGQRLGRLSDMTISKSLRSVVGKGPTVHGTARSSFRTWVAEQTDFPGEIAEAALAHKVPDLVERAYKRTDFFEKRRLLMDQWAAFITGEACHD